VNNPRNTNYLILSLISRDVEFVEEEAWDGNIDKTTTIVASVPQENEGNETQVLKPTT
jgi:hypothetical protein